MGGGVYSLNVPELPEVETTRAGISPHLVGKRVSKVVIRQPKLRWPIPRNLKKDLTNQLVTSLDRRAKYLLMGTDAGTAIIHLGMSGSFQVIQRSTPPGKHDHYDIVLESGNALRFNDPRRFGSLLWTRRPPHKHKLLANLGPEPLSDAFDGNYLYRQAQGRKATVKQFIMNGHVVVGVGNIYASESLYLAGIHPRRPAGRIGLSRMALLARAIKQVLTQAIEAGGTTLRDFLLSDGTPGYFQQQLNVYGRAGEPCVTCKKPIRQEVMGQRSTFFCVGCQR